jgi:hypothetical protein
VKESPNQGQSDATIVSAEDGQVTRRIANAVLLFERRVMLFIDDDQAKLGQGCEYRQAGAEDDTCLASQCGTPVAATRSLTQLAVQADQPGIWKTSRDPGFELWRQVDFRYQQERLLPCRQAAFDQAEIDFGLAAAGDAVQ